MLKLLVLLPFLASAQTETFTGAANTRPNLSIKKIRVAVLPAVPREKFGSTIVTAMFAPVDAATGRLVGVGSCSLDVSFVAAAAPNEEVAFSKFNRAPFFDGEISHTLQLIPKRILGPTIPLAILVKVRSDSGNAAALCPVGDAKLKDTTELACTDVE